MVANVGLNFGPILKTVANIANDMPAAMMQYSMAVAPDCSFRKRKKRATMSPPACSPSIMLRINAFLFK